MDYPISKDPPQTTYCGIDLIKFICSFLVIAIHVPPLQSVNPWIDFGIRNCFARIAVPFYFTASGFFVFRKSDLRDFSFEPSFSFSKKIFRLYGTWMTVLIFGGTGHLWYLPGAVVAVLLVSLLRLWKFSIRSIGLFSVLFYLIGTLGISYYGLIDPYRDSLLIKAYILTWDKVTVLSRGLFLGTVYIFIGMAFAYCPIHLKRWVCVSGFITSLLLLLAEAVILNRLKISKDFYMYLSLIPATFFLFYIATHIHLKNSKIYGVLRILGSLIYFSHMLAYSVASYAIRFAISLGVSETINHSLVRYSATVLLSFVFSWVIYRLSQTKRFRVCF